VNKDYREGIPRFGTVVLLVGIVLLPLLSVVRAQQAPTPKRILVLYWYNRDYPGDASFSQNFQAVLQSAPAGTVEYHSEYLESNRFPGENQSLLLRDYLRQKYSSLTIDVAVAAGDPPLDFLLKYRDDLFTHTPIVFAAVKRPTAKELTAGPGITGFINLNAYRETLDLALKLHPGTEQVFIISGLFEGEKIFETQAREKLQGYESKVRITYLTNFPLDELIAKTKSLPERSIVFYVWQQARDKQGKLLESPDVLALIANSTPVPIYGVASWQVGRGVVGGYVRILDANGTRAAEVALQIVNGARAQDIPVESTPTVPIFDWRELERWGISEDRLPPGKIVLFKEPTIWEEYKRRIIGIVALCILQTLLIAVLLDERKRRQQAKRLLDESFHLEEMISEFSAILINLPASQIEAEIESGLTRINKFLGLGRTVVFEISTETNHLRVIHTWQDENVAPLPADLHASGFDWAVAKMRRGEMVIFEKITDLPTEAASLKEYCSKLGIKSGVIFPLTQRDNTLIGTSFMAMRAEQNWPVELVRQLRVIGDTCVSALERKHAEQILRESEERFHTMADTTPVMIWVSGPDKLCTFFNRPWLEFTGRTMEQELGNGWAEGVHREDLQRCLETYSGAFDARRDFHMEYRLRRSDGEYRWVLDTGVPRYTPAGQFAGYIGSCLDFTERRKSEDDLRNALSEVERLKDQLQEENVYLQEEIKLSHNFQEMVGESDALKYVLYKVEQVAPTDSTVLLLGETGTGKELVAHAIHDHSTRKDRSLVKVNCASLPATLIESELFGHEKGAFTGASARKLGRFELANGGTLFLDEIGELPLELQPKLLRVLQEGEFERLGGSQTIKVNVRIIAATNRDIMMEVKNGLFREDLWYRLNVFPITLPPLRQRKEDIPLLVNFFANLFGKMIGKPIKNITPEALEALQDYSWPGNVRELANVIERAVINVQGTVLYLANKLQPSQTANLSSNDKKSLTEMERDIILQRLEETDWKIEGPNGTARSLGLTPSTLRFRMTKLGIQRPKSS
jgi:PAS domain S-box-containing protein